MFFFHLKSSSNRSTHTTQHVHRRHLQSVFKSDTRNNSNYSQDQFISTHSYTLNNPVNNKYVFYTKVSDKHKSLYITFILYSQCSKQCSRCDLRYILYFVFFQHFCKVVLLNEKIKNEKNIE